MGRNQRFGNYSLFLYDKFEQVHLYDIIMYESAIVSRDKIIVISHLINII